MKVFQKNIYPKDRVAVGKSRPALGGEAGSLARRTRRVAIEMDASPTAEAGASYTPWRDD